MQQFDFDHPPQDPLPLLESWLSEATERCGLPNPNAMGLATVGADGKPSLRMVLMKNLGPDGVVFFTNDNSRKGLDLAANPIAAVLFHWDTLQRQIRIEGAVSRTTPQENDEYFASRPRMSRIGAVASPQSQPVKNRAHLDKLVSDVEEQYPDENVPRPNHWGGYRIAFQQIEFWEGGKARLHDRIVYARDGDSWQVKRLAP